VVVVLLVQMAVALLPVEMALLVQMVTPRLEVLEVVVAVLQHKHLLLVVTVVMVALAVVAEAAVV
jgi:hypothetical protein